MKSTPQETCPVNSISASCKDEFIINFGNSYSDNAPVQKTMAWGDLVEQFSIPDTRRGQLTLNEYQALDKTMPEQKRMRDAEKNGHYFIMAAFSKAGTRSGADIVSVSGFTGDIDTGAISKAFIQTKLQGYRYLAYSSYSHSPTFPMWRFVLQYSRPITKADHEKVYAYFQDIFDNQLDSRCKTTAQLWYTPACPPDAVQYFEFITGDGELLDPDKLPEVVTTKTSKRQALATISPQLPQKSLSNHQLTRLKSALEAILADDRGVWIRIGLALRQDVGAETGYSIWLEWSKKSAKFDETEAEETWDSFRGTAPDKAVTLGTIFYLAKENGWADTQRDMPEKVKELDDRHFMAFEGGKSWVFKEDYDQELHRPMLTRIALKHFTDYYANQKISVPVGEKFKMIDIGRLWHDHPARRSYEKIVFLPGLLTPEGCYNLWRGFSYPPIQGDWSLLQKHIRDVICNNDVESMSYLLNWMAYAIQFPNRVGEVAIVMKGERGTGKGKLAHLFALLFGEHALEITQTKHLIGNFNAHLRTCVFLFLDEAIWAGDKEGENILKGLITEPTIQIEKKHMDTIASCNRLHIMMASNNDWVVPAGNKERRYFVIDVNDSHIQDHAYFAAIDNQMLNQGGLSAMMYDLMHRDLSTFEVRKFKWTEALDEQILRSLDPAMQWWMDQLGITHKIWEFQSRAVLSDSFAQNHGTFNFKSSETKLGIFLRKVVPGGVKKVSHAFDLNHNPVSCYQFPDQQTCRKAFISKLGLQLDPWGYE